MSRMVMGWNYAMNSNLILRKEQISEDDILILGAAIEPEVNKDGYRQVEVEVGGNRKISPQIVPTAMSRLLELGGNLDPGAWFYEYEEIHPFIDGNGRTGQILFNWLNGTLSKPVMAPNFWNDNRREIDTHDATEIPGYYGDFE